LHAFHAADFVDTAKPPTAYSRIDSATHFATPKSDKDVIWIQKKSFLCMGSHLLNPGPSSQELKSG